MEIIIAIIGATIAIIVAVVTTVTTAIKINKANMDSLRTEIRAEIRDLRNEIHDVRNLLIAHISGHSHYVGITAQDATQNK